jgi:SAM-dependent methyltransferase
VEAVDGSGFVSRFSSGATVRVTRSRARTYPGLACPAPPTIPFYRLALRDLAPGAVALDAGCGCGTHLAEIASRFETVIGVDVDDEAIAFARLHFPEARWVVANLTNLPPLGPVDAAFVVDVLGHGPYPFEVLRALHRVLAPHARLCVWEPAAYPSQTLIAPARRAFP